MAYDYSKFDKVIDTEGLKQDIKEAEKNGKGNGDFLEVPDGQYEVKIIKLELVGSKKGDPMVATWFEILSGDYKGQKLFWNQVVSQGFQIHKLNLFLRSLDTGVDVKFDTFSQYGDMLLDIMEEVDHKLEYAIELKTDEKGFNSYEVLEVFEV